MAVGLGSALLSGCGSGESSEPTTQPTVSESQPQSYLDSKAGDMAFDPEYYFTELLAPDGKKLECVVFGESDSDSSSISCDWDRLAQERTETSTP